MQRKLERRRRRKGEEARRADDSRPTTVASEQHPPAEPRLEQRSPSHHVTNGKYSPGKNSPIAGRPPPSAGGGEGPGAPSAKKYTASNKTGMLLIGLSWW